MDAIEKTLEALEDRMAGLRFSVHTRTAYRAQVKEWLTALGEDPRRATRVEAERFRDSMGREGASASTITQALAAVKFFYEEVLRAPDPTHGVRRPKRSKSLPTVLTRGEAQSLLGQLSDPYLLAARLMLGCGLRVSEALNLRVENLEPGATSLWVRRGKREKDRLVQVPKPLAKDLAAWARGKDPKTHVVGGGKEAYSPDSIQSSLKEAARGAGIMKNVHPHTLRHTYATLLYDSGVDIRTIADLMGHESLETTQRYAKMTDVSKERARGAIDLLL